MIRSNTGQREKMKHGAKILLVAAMLVTASACGTMPSPTVQTIKALNPTVVLKCTASVEVGGVPIIGVSGACAAGIDDASCWSEETGALLVPVNPPENTGE